MRIKIPTKEELAKKYKREYYYLKNKDNDYYAIDTSILRKNIPKEEEQSKDNVSIKEEEPNIPH